MKSVLLILLLGIVFSLGSALTSMTRKAGPSRAMANALTVRVALSISLILFLVIGWGIGWIEPGNL
ncbi:MAG: DUF2909 domain-containing protein [Woeseiaceae bacterium]|nr:DUF2909 domain-containing protein [Woeseiaceae bacterium]